MALPPTSPPGLVRDAEDLNKVVNGDGTTNRAGDSLPSIKAILGVVEDRRDSAVLAIDGYVSNVDARRGQAVSSIQNDQQAVSNIRDGAEQSFQDAISSLTVTTPFDFTTGGTVTARNQAILWPVSDGGDGSQYRWDGELPKEVPPNSTPDSAGGEGVGAWVDVGQAALRSDLANPDKGARLVRGAVIYVDTIADLQALNTATLVDGQAALVQGSEFLWDGTANWSPSGSVNIKAFGAKGDGVTDDTDAIDAALTSAGIDFAKLVFTKGTYIVSRTTIEMNKHTEIYMEPGAWLKVKDGERGVRVFNANSFCKLTVHIDGNQFPVSGDIQDDWGDRNWGVYFNSLPEEQITDVLITKSTFHNLSEPVRLNGNARVSVTNSVFWRVRQTGVLCSTRDEHHLHDILIYGNKFEELGDVAVATFTLSGSTSALRYNILVQNNVAVNTNLRTMGYAFNAEPTDSHPGNAAFNHSYIGNVVRQTDTRPSMYATQGRGGVILGRGVERSLISNNVVTGVPDAPGFGISVDGSVDCVCSNNYVEGFRHGGINAAGAFGINISGNRLEKTGNSDDGSSQRSAILLATGDYSTEGFHVSDNHIVLNKGVVGIRSAPYSGNFSKGGVIQNNQIIADDGRGIAISNTKNTTILGNVVDYRGRDTDTSFHVSGGENIVLKSNCAYNTLTPRLEGINGLSISDFYVECSSGQSILRLLNSSNVSIYGMEAYGDCFLSEAPSDPIKGLLTGSFNSQDRGVAEDIATSTEVFHNLNTAPRAVIITPISNGVTSFRVGGFSSSSFYIYYTGDSPASFHWMAIL